MPARDRLLCRPSLSAPHQETASAAGTLLEGQPDWQAIAFRRIHDLEAALQKSGTTLHALQTSLDRIQSSDGWRLLTGYYKVRNRLFPKGSLRRAGAAVLFHSARWMLRLLADRQSPSSGTGEDLYARWIAKNEPNSRDLARQRRQRFAHEPLISILAPVYRAPLPFLEGMIDSVLAQTYPHWQLCLAHDGSLAEEVGSLLQRYARRDRRIYPCLLEESRGITASLATALELASSPYLALLDHGDLLSPFALFEVVKALNDNPDADFLYSDEDHLDVNGQRQRPHFKPDWSPDTLCGHNYIGHLVVLRRQLLLQAGGFRPGFEGAQDYDLILRATEQATRIVHIPRVLYHRRFLSPSSIHTHTQMGTPEAGRRALEEHLQRLSISAQVKHGPMPGLYEVVRSLPRQPLVSILIPTHDQHETLDCCLKSIARSSYCHYEILLVENNSKEPETFAYYKQLSSHPQVRLLTWQGPFNYAAVNNWAAAQAQGEVLLLLNNDTEVRNADWLERLLEHALRPEVGAVGAKLYYPDGSIQHAGVLVGVGGVAAHAHQFCPGVAAGYFHRLVVTQNLSAVTGACLMLRREVFAEVGGMDERYVLTCNDVDLCLRIRQKGYRVIWTPFAELSHHEIKTRGFDTTPAKAARLAAELSCFQSVWKDVLLAGDPYYNPSLNVKSGDFCLRL